MRIFPSERIYLQELLPMLEKNKAQIRWMFVVSLKKAKNREEEEK